MNHLLHLPSGRPNRGDEDRAFEENEGFFYHPTVQHMQPLVAKAFRKHVYDKSNNYHIKPPKTHYRIAHLVHPGLKPILALRHRTLRKNSLIPTHLRWPTPLTHGELDLSRLTITSPSTSVLLTDWIIDSGTIASCTPHKSYFRLSMFRSCSMTLTIGDGGQLPILGYDPVDLTVLSRNITKGPDHQSEPHFLSLPFGLYCPNVKFNLLSVRHAVSSGYQVKFDHPEHCLFILDKTYYFRAAVNILGLYSFSATEVPSGCPLPPRDTLTTRAMLDGFKAFLVANPVSPPLPSHPPSLHSTAFTASVHFPSHHQALNAF
ncbi:hypothetical protein H257_16272 [Aphanomyces astaci]|uniref:Uncharacterized protein n=1 Tax=Aphanomyces astaci TaxID=112090 RepID=W4FKZ2_APHAT|nr:hypothetical protein H257_16272 [Aphanomyces astaci]ETV67541.1 hypothetical protein H257_16272 [Aphanomyces astaci]|eukprot:XP_009842945.1 hypothetical protein H257_16272 [Aphanomyces astaci]